MPVLKLFESADPVVEVEVAPGDVRRYDPFEIQEKVESDLRVPRSDKTETEVMYASLRTHLALNDATSRHKLLLIWQHINAFVRDQDVIKNMSGLPPASSNTASNPPK